MASNQPPAASPEQPSMPSTGNAATHGSKSSHDLDEKDVVRVAVDDQVEALDLYKPLPPLEGVAEEPMPLTIRAILTGVCLGSLVNAANVYLGLKTGFTFPAGMFGSIFGYGIIKSISKAVPHDFPILGGPFGPQENSIIQATAVGAGGLSGLFVAALPAMYNLGLLDPNKDVRNDLGRIYTLTLIGSFFGLFFAIPLRKFFIINVARELKLIFPTREFLTTKGSILGASPTDYSSATATALTIRSMHAVGSGAADAMQKMKALGYAFLFAFVLRIVSDYALGILWDWHIFTWFYIWGDYNNYAIVIENWGWYIELTPAFIGSGLLVGLNVAISYFIGSFIAWGFVGPLLVYTGVCVGDPTTNPDPRWAAQVSYFGMSGIDKPGYVPSPRYWFLWPGVMVLLCYSMAEFVFHWKILYQGIRYAWVEMASKLNSVMASHRKPNSWLQKQAAKRIDESSLVEDFVAPEQQVPIWLWTWGIVAVLVVSIIIFEVQFHINGGLAIVGSILALVFAFMSIHGSAVTDVTPLTASSKASQLVFGGITHGQEPKHAQTVNLISGIIASSGADMSNALTSDFRTGFLLRTPPKLQFYAQAVGCLVAMFLAPAIFLLFAKAYPCLLSLETSGSCAFPAPSVWSWAAVARAVTLPSIPITLSSGIFSIVLGVIAVAQVFIKNTYLVGEREHYRNWLPNWMSLGIAFVLPATHYSTAMLTGAIIAHFWVKRSPHSFDVYCYAIAGGMIAGEGLGGVIQAILTLGEVSGKEYGSEIACPGGSCH